MKKTYKQLVSENRKLRAEVKRWKAAVEAGARLASRLILDMGPIHLDRLDRVITVEGRLVHLPYCSFRLMEILMQQPGETVSVEQLMRGIWTQEERATPNKLHVLVHRTRNALGRAGAFIANVHGKGYVIRNADEDEHNRLMAAVVDFMLPNGSRGKRA